MAKSHYRAPQRMNRWRKRKEKRHREMAFALARALKIPAKRMREINVVDALIDATVISRLDERPLA